MVHTSKGPLCKGGQDAVAQGRAIDDRPTAAMGVLAIAEVTTRCNESIAPYAEADLGCKNSDLCVGAKLELVLHLTKQ